MSFQTESSHQLASPFAFSFRRLAQSVTTVGRSAFKPSGPRHPTAAAVQASPDLGNREPVQAGANVRSAPDLEVAYDADRGIYWQWMRPQKRPSYTMELLAAMEDSLLQAQSLVRANPGGMRYLVTGSRVPGVFNLGGDLPHFARLIENRDRDGLRAYAHACIAVQYGRATNMGESYVSISLVQGDALGGGFECALADDVIIAERGTKFGLPEVLFGLFPGMGAYSFLSRKLGDALAERMILSGKTYTAEELHEMGLVAALAEPGDGEAAVLDFIRNDQRCFRARTALSHIRRNVEPVTWEELIGVTDTWVETALTLGPLELRKMRRLATAQDRRWAEIHAETATASPASTQQPTQRPAQQEAVAAG